MEKTILNYARVLQSVAIRWQCLRLAELAKDMQMATIDRKDKKLSEVDKLVGSPYRAITEHKQESSRPDLFESEATFVLCQIQYELELLNAA